MRISAHTAGVLALALAAAAPASAAAQQEPSILFLVQRMQDEGEADAFIEPVAFVHENGYEDPVFDMDENAWAAFDAQWFPAGRRYGVLSRGMQAGTATVVEPMEQGCGGLGARVTVAGLRPGVQRALAGQGLPAQNGAPWMREPTRDERRTLDRMAAALFAAHGTDVAGRTEADTSVATVLFHRNARPVLVGSYALKTDDVVMRQAAAFIIAEEGQDGYRPAYARFHEGRVPDFLRSELLDALDLDGDGMPELVLQNAYWESWDYSILTRDEHGWMESYRGGGGGC